MVRIIGLHHRDKSKRLRSRGSDRWHYEHNKLVSHPPPGRTDPHLDIGGLFDTNKSPAGEEKVRSSWKLASGRQLRPIWHWSPDWLAEKFTDGSLRPDLGCKTNKAAVACCRCDPSGAQRRPVILQPQKPVFTGKEWRGSCLPQLFWFLSLLLLIESIVAGC